jgi:predicted membrane chloride channel (bestrophin family)
LLDEVQAARFAPAIILRRLGELVQQLQREGCLNEWQWQALDRKLDTMSEILGGASVSTPHRFHIPIVFCSIARSPFTACCCRWDWSAA